MLQIVRSFVESYYAFDEASDEMKEQALGYAPQVYWNPASKLLGEYVRGERKLVV